MPGPSALPRLLDPAVPSQRPLAPKRGQLTALGLGLALGLAVGAVMLAEQVRPKSFHHVDDLRDFAPVPVLVSIPHIVTKTAVKRRRQRYGLAVLGAMLGLMLIVGSSYVIASGNEELVRVFLR